MSAMLIVRTAGVDQFVELGDRTLIGRHATNDVQILDDEVSARQCLIERKDEAYLIRDLNSEFGTVINRDFNDGNAERLFHHDLIKMGATVIRFEHPPSGERPVPADQELEKLRNEFSRRLVEARTGVLLPPGWNQLDRGGSADTDREVLGKFFSVTRKLLAAPDEETLLKEALDFALSVCDASGGSVSLIGEDGELEVAAVVGTVTGSDDDVARASSRRTPVVRRSSLPAIPWRITIPMCVGDDERGIICLEARRGNDVKNVLLAETIANLAAALIDALRSRRVLH